MKIQSVRFLQTFFSIFLGALLAGAETPELGPPSAQVTENVTITGAPSSEAPEAQLAKELEPSIDASFDNKLSENSEMLRKQVFAEATSQNSGVANEISNSGPMVVTLGDGATAELQQRAAVIPSQNENVPPATNQSNSSKSASVKNADQQPITDKNTTESELGSSSSSEKAHVIPDVPSPENLTEEEIPSFSEWAQKRLEEAEKNKEATNTSVQPQATNGKQQKLRWKNYASLDCGAKVVASNPEAQNPSAVLSPSRDEYKLNTCTSRVWFVVELCEAIQAKKIDLANFELFSSSPKDFSVFVSDRFPTREWSNVGQFAAKDERDVQSFDLHPHLFGKFVKVEVKSHYGAEHFCPISLFRVYGTSEFEVLQKEDQVHAGDHVEYDDDEEGETLDTEDAANNNLFSSATDAVISMVKKAAQVLGNKKGNLTATAGIPGQNRTATNVSTIVPSCTSPAHLVVCDNCSDTLFGQVYELLSCRSSFVDSLSSSKFIYNALTRSHPNVCRNFGFAFRKTSNDKCEDETTTRAITSFLSMPLLGAICNSIAITENKVVLNTSHQFSNTTENVSKTEEDIVNIKTSQEKQLPSEVIEDSPEATTSPSDITSQIKPTKTITSEVEDEVATVVTPSLPPPLSTEEAQPVEPTPQLVTNETTSTSATEVIQEMPKEVTREVENGEGLDDSTLELISELNGEGQGSSTPSTSSVTPQVQKESVFLRLSNRIKALERNMSLSGQYLEELSKRYKKQVEEMQKLLDKTTLSFTEEIKKMDLRNKELEERLDSLTLVVETLVTERNNWMSTFYCAVIVVSVVFVLSFCRKSSNEPSAGGAANSVEVARRQSIDVVRHSAPPKKKRRPSDQALKIVRSSMEEDERKDLRKRNKKKRQQQLKRSNSITTLDEEYQGFQPSLTSSQVWRRQESAPPDVHRLDWVEEKRLEDIPFALEESEHSTLECLDGLERPQAAFPQNVPNFVRTASNTRLARTNGSVSNQIRKKSPTPNGNAVALPDAPSKQKKGLRRIFKKVW